MDSIRKRSHLHGISNINPCTEDATATVTVIEQAEPNAGTNGTLTVCEGIVPSNSELFDQLGGYT